MKAFRACLLSLLSAAAATSGQAGDGDARRGVDIYRDCVACHSLEPGVHLTGPSLANIWGKKAGRIEGYGRYSSALRGAEFSWDAGTLDAWLADPRAMVPGTFMVFRGIEDERSRADLIAFLERGLAEGGFESIVRDGLVTGDYVRGQRPEPLTPSSDNQRVTAVRHCGDGFFVTTADGTQSSYWEMNVRLKVDTRATGPEPGKPVIAGAGMLGDRVSIIFASLGDLHEFVVEAC
jgi:cytochrome c